MLNIIIFSYINTSYTILLIFFFNDTATTEIYTLSLHDALPIYFGVGPAGQHDPDASTQPEPGVGDLIRVVGEQTRHRRQDRKSTRLNSSHVEISYAVFCLKKKKKKKT